MNVLPIGFDLIEDEDGAPYPHEFQIAAYQRIQDAKVEALRAVDGPLVVALIMLDGLAGTPEGRLAYHCVHEAMKRLASGRVISDVAADRGHFEDLLPAFYRAMRADSLRAEAPTERNEEGVIDPLLLMVLAPMLCIFVAVVALMLGGKL